MLLKIDRFESLELSISLSDKLYILSSYLNVLKSRSDKGVDIMAGDK